MTRADVRQALVNIFHDAYWVLDCVESEPAESFMWYVFGMVSRWGEEEEQ